MKFAAIRLALSLATLLLARGQEKPATQLSQSLIKCHLTDKSQLDQCLVDYYTDALQLLSSGIDGGPRIDPLELDRIKLPEVGVYINGLATCDNLTLSGLSNSVVTQVTSDVAKQSMSVDLNIPLLRIQCNYHLNATVMSIPVVGAGLAVANLTDNNATMVFELELDEPGFRLAKFNLTVAPKKLQTVLDNLVGTEEENEVVRKLINDNGVTLYNEARPFYELLYSRSGHKVFAPLMKQFPCEVFDTEDSGRKALIHSQLATNCGFFTIP